MGILQVTSAHAEVGSYYFDSDELEQRADSFRAARCAGEANCVEMSYGYVDGGTEWLAQTKTQLREEVSQLDASDRCQVRP